MVCRRREAREVEIQRVTCEIALRPPEPDDRVINGRSILLLNALLNRLMMRSQSSGTAKNDATCRFSPRLLNRPAMPS